MATGTLQTKIRSLVFHANATRPRFALPASSGGRLIFPLEYRRENSIAGGGFLLQRDGSGISARFLGRAYFFPAEGEVQLSTDYRKRMHTAFDHGQPSRVRRLVWQTTKPEDGIWFAGHDWALCEDRN